MRDKTKEIRKPNEGGRRGGGGGRLEGGVREDGRKDEKDAGWGGGGGGRKKIVERRKKKKQRKKKTKERGPRGRQRPTCLKSLKARSNVSPWKPATGPALAKPVGKYKPAPPQSTPGEREERRRRKKKRVKNGIIKDLVGFAMHRDRLADK